jgi:hypothetical protein
VSEDRAILAALASVALASAGVLDCKGDKATPVAPAEG